MAMFKVVAFTPEDFERLVYMASERQIHQHDGNMAERVSMTYHVAGYVLDPAEYPLGTKFLLVWEDK